MRTRIAIGTFALAAALWPAPGFTQSTDAATYPDWSGQWTKTTDGRWDPDKPRGAGQEAPFTEEYRAKLMASLAAQAAGGQGNDSVSKCLPPGMPRMMIAYDPIAFAVTPETTYMFLEFMSQHRRIYTDGRDWPDHGRQTFVGTSIGRWIDESGNGRYDTLAVETRDIAGPRTFDSSGGPLHSNNRTVVKERFFLDKADKDVLHDEVTTIDDALTRPWTVLRTFRREPHPIWNEHICSEDNHQVVIGSENYFRSGDGHLMPARKDQPPPDLRYFERAKIAPVAQ